MDITAEHHNPDYKVDLQVFQGPLDLLLYLIKKEEVDIYDIPLARITKQYLQYIELMQNLDLEIAGEFILMAATLIRIKTRMLLPRNDEDSEELDPREELVMALIEYKKYREAGDMLRDRAILEEHCYVPPSPIGKLDTKVDLCPATTLFDLLTSFKEVLESNHEEKYHQVKGVEVTIEERVSYILQYMKDRETATFIELFLDIPRKIVAVTTFLALLEMVRARRVTLAQSAPFRELRIYRGERFTSSFEAIDLFTIDSVNESERVMVS